MHDTCILCGKNSEDVCICDFIDYKGPQHQQNPLSQITDQVGYLPSVQYNCILYYSF